MTHDRVEGNDLMITHEFLSIMLGVRRAGVTEALHDLRDRELIELARRDVTIKDRKGLEKLAGAFYGVPEREYRRVVTEVVQSPLQMRWSRFPGQNGGLAKVDSGFDYAANFSSLACVA